MDGDICLAEKSLTWEFFFGHEYDEYPVSIIVSISCCFSCKVVLEEVLEKRALRVVLGLESTQLHSSIRVGYCATKQILEWLRISTKSS